MPIKRNRGIMVKLQNMNMDDFVVSSPMTPASLEPITVSLDSEPEQGEFMIVIPDIPGAPGTEEIFIDDEDEDADKESEGDEDPWDWTSKGVGGFLDWLQGMIKGIPQHSGYDSTGLERAISYFEALDKEITKAMRTDYKNEIDSANAEKAREEIEKGLDRLIDRLEKINTSKYKRKSNKKKAWYQQEEGGFVKEAQKATRINGITVTVPLTISRIARVCINGVVSAGHDLEDLFHKLADEEELDKREKADLAQLLADMGYPMHRDRGFAPGTPVDVTKSDNRDWAANYYG
jgi:hypothetical protein